MRAPSAGRVPVLLAPRTEAGAPPVQRAVTGRAPTRATRPGQLPPLFRALESCAARAHRPVRGPCSRRCANANALDVDGEHAQ